MKVLVTGATGFNGGHLARVLQSKGHQVRALVRPGSSFAALERDGIEIVTGQLTQPSDVDRAVRGCDQVYHLAAVFRTAGHPDSYYREVNVDAVDSILVAARKHGCERVVHCSTIGVHGHVKDPPAREDAPFAPADIYQHTKLEGESRARKSIERGEPVVIVRPAICYGEGDTRLLKMFRGIHRGIFHIIGTGQNRLHLVHSDDLSDGFVRAGRVDEAKGHTFIIAGPDAPTLEDLVGKIARILDVRPPRVRIPLAPVVAAAALCEALCVPFGIDPPLHRRRVSFFKHHREFDCSKAAAILGYRPTVTSDIGVARTAAWYFQKQLLKGPPPAQLVGLLSARSNSA